MSVDADELYRRLVASEMHIGGVWPTTDGVAVYVASNMDAKHDTYTTQIGPCLTIALAACVDWCDDLFGGGS